MSTNQAEHPLENKSAPPQVFNETDRIVICTPCYGGMMQFEHAAAVTKALMQIEARFRLADGTVQMMPLIAERFYLDKESHIDRGRIKLANMFMRTPYRFLLWLDADIVFEPEHIAVLWSHAMRGNPFVCAPYAMKGIVPQFAVNVAKGAEKREDGLVEVVNAGTGFMINDRVVFKTLEDSGRAEEYELGSNDPHAHDWKTARQYFKSGVRKLDDNGRERKLWLSEDYMLCYEWQKCGGKVMMDYRMQLGHIGTIKFPVEAVELSAAFKELRRINHPALPKEPI